MNMNVAENILNKNLKNINDKDVVLTPCGRRVIFLPYEDNPYKAVETDKSGVIFGIESTKHYKSTDSGEMEDNMMAVICAKVIAVGPDCKYVSEGDDIFVVKSVGSMPVPFRKKGYYIIDEMNVLCKMTS